MKTTKTKKLELAIAKTDRSRAIYEYMGEKTWLIDSLQKSRFLNVRGANGDLIFINIDRIETLRILSETEVDI